MTKQNAARGGAAQADETAATNLSEQRTTPPAFTLILDNGLSVAGQPARRLSGGRGWTKPVRSPGRRARRASARRKRRGGAW